MEIWNSLVGAFASMIQFSYQATQTIGVPNYGLAIIFITIFIKIVLYPLTAKQMKSMKAMSVLQPKIKAIQDKNKKNPQKAQQEIMDMYKEAGVNPLSGCLPLLIQLPILIAFYNALMHLEYTNPGHAKFLWVPSLQSADPFYLLPILAGVTTYLSMKVSTVPTSTGNDQAAQTQKMMTYMMPVLIGWMAMSFPSGLALYWVTFNVIGTIQQMYINKTNQDPGKKGEATA